MGLFGETCVRCGQSRTRSTFEGLPTCDDCESEIRASRETPRRCPVDGSRMEKDVVQNVVVDRCSSCRGIWLDGDEVRLVKGVVGKGGAGDFTTGLLIGLIVGDD